MTTAQYDWSSIINQKEHRVNGHGSPISRCSPHSPVAPVIVPVIKEEKEPIPELISLSCALCDYRSSNSNDMTLHRKWHVQLATRERHLNTEPVAEPRTYFEAAAALATPIKHELLTNQMREESIESTVDHRTTKRVYTPVREAVDPGKYMIIHEIDGTKYACTRCGNIYKWRKSLNKHWKEKHGSLKPPSLEAGMLPLVEQPKRSPLPGTIPSAATAYFLSLQTRQPPSSSSISYGEFASPAIGPRQTETISPPEVERKTSISGLTSSTTRFGYDDNIPLDLSRKCVSEPRSTNREAGTSLRGGAFSRYEPYNANTVTPPTSRANVPATPYDDSCTASLYRQLTSTILSSQEETCKLPKIPDMKWFLPNDANDLDLAAGGTVVVIPKSPEDVSMKKLNNQWHTFNPMNAGTKAFRQRSYSRREFASSTPNPDTGSMPSLPYKCDTCDFRARWPSEINQHRKNHSNVKPYACPRCTYRSKWKWDVVKHLKRCGGGNGSEVSVRDVIDNSEPSEPVTSRVEGGGSSFLRGEDDILKSYPVLSVPLRVRFCKKCDFASKDIGELLLHQKHQHPVMVPTSGFSIATKNACPSSSDGESTIAGDVLCDDKYDVIVKRLKRKRKLTEKQRKRKLKNVKREVFKCNKCSYLTRYQRLLRQHTTSYHSEPIVEKISNENLRDIDVAGSEVDATGSEVDSTGSKVEATERESLLTCDKCPYEVTSAADMHNHVTCEHHNNEGVQ